MFCAPGAALDGTECAWSRLHVLPSQTHYQRYRERRVSFSCFALPDTFSAVARSPGTFFMFCAPELILGGTEGVGSRFQALRSWTRFGRY
jgi:hypothetical protein